MLLHLAAVHLGLPAAARDPWAAGQWRNVLLVVVAPALLGALAFWITRTATGPLPMKLPVFRAGVGLVAWASLACLWSPFPAGAIKAPAYLLAFGGLFFAWRVLFRGDAAAVLPPVLAVAVASAAGLGLVHTLAFPGTLEATHGRFTSFVAPQSFGLSLAIVFGLTLHLARSGLLAAMPAALLAAAAAVTVLLNGSRQASVAIALLWLVAFVPGRALAFRHALHLPAAILGLALLLGAGVHRFAPETLRPLASAERAGALLLLSPDHLQQSGDAGTIRDRLKIASALAQRYVDAGPVAWAVGLGTAASAAVIADGEVRYRDYGGERVDYSRSAHNEFLRSLYEWGIPGAALFSMLVALPLCAAGQLLLATRRSEDLLLFVTAGVALVGFSLFGNTLASSGEPLGVLLALVYALVLAREEDVHA
jgi:hypothetical protein